MVMQNLFLGGGGGGGRGGGRGDYHGIFQSGEWYAVWKCLLGYFGLGKRENREKFNRSYLQRRKMEKRSQEEFLTTCECLNRKKTSQQLPPCVIATRDSLFCNMFSP